MIKINLKFNRGYTLLFAVLVSSLVLSVGVSILNIGKKEFLLSSSARESMVAFYAADSGIGCAKYYDDIGKFATSSTDYTTVNCAKKVSNMLYNQNSPAVGEGTFTFDVNINDSSCAKVIVEKTEIYTTIESRGYNIGWSVENEECSLPSPRRVERGLRYVYDSSPNP